MTEKLYYADSHIKEFTVVVTACERRGEGYAVLLDRTAFFPEGGGQLGDSGRIGAVTVFDTHERDGEVLHYVNQPLSVGKEYPCAIDWEKRFRRMQNHSGEHILSGLVHKKYGYNNVGFHMGSDVVTIDFDGYLSPEQLGELEREANFVIAENLPVRTGFPTAEELKSLEYRSKKELEGEVRIVEIEGVDRCACCAPHVYATAEVGALRILSSERRRRGGEGTRLTMLCGLDAYEHEAEIGRQNDEIAVMLSAKRGETAAAVRRLLAERDALSQSCSELMKVLADLKAGAIEPSDGNLVVFDNVLDTPARRRLANALVEKCGGLAAVLSGSDETGYKYIIGSAKIDLRKAARKINEGISGRGGGSPEMIQGNCTECSVSIQKFLTNFTI